MNRLTWMIFLAGLVLGSLAPHAHAQIMQLTDGTFAIKAVAYLTNGTAVTW
jgi:hypothetical protein